MRQGEVLSDRGEYASALDAYLWALDEGVDVDSSFIGVRDSALIRRLIELGRLYAPAMDQLQKRRAELDGRVRSGKQARDVDVDLLVAMNEALGKEDETLRVYQDLVQAKSSTAEQLDDDVSRVLLRRKQYGDLLAHEGRLRDSLSLSADAAAFSRRSVWKAGGELIEVLVGTKRLSEADAVLAQLEALDASSGMYAEVIRHIVRAGDKEYASLLLDRALTTVTDEQRAELEAVGVELDLTRRTPD